MKCDVIIPVGPGHEEIHQQAVESVRIASKWAGPFTDVKIKVVDDTKAELGRSKARNLAAENSDADWLFFLDADDRIHPKAFESVEEYVIDYDAIWGNIYEYTGGIAVWRYQVPEIASYQDLISYDPYLTIQMGHFIRNDKFQPFNEEMNCGEDWDYYLKIWKSCNCIKIDRCLFLNQRGVHSTGPKSATGVQWTNAVHPMIENAREEYHKSMIDKDIVNEGDVAILDETVSAERADMLHSIPFPGWEQVRARMKLAHTLVDVGPGIRPQDLVPTSVHICVEPHHEYVEILKDEYPVICGKAIDVVPLLKGIDTFVCLDVIEHMEKEEGLKLIEEMKKIARQQIVIFTPNGFEPQSHPDGVDKWGMNGGFWQEHRSGWTPEDFPGWEIHIAGKGFFAIWQ